jgi:uncharacterized membrane protein HdeD (DUF308 family)
MTLCITGALALVAGLVITVWPKGSALVLVVMLGTYFIAAGLAYVVSGAFSKGLSGNVRASEIILGALFLIGGILVLTNPSETAVVLGIFVGIFVGIAWIAEGIVALVQAASSPSKGWAVVFGVLSVSAGAVLLFSPTWGTAALFAITGISLIVLGAIQFVRAFTIGRQTKTAA